MGMMGVDKIGEIRRAHFEQKRSIKEIVRTLSVSRATVRKIICSHQTEFKYERDVQPSPKLGVWVAALTEILEEEAGLPKRERRSTQQLYEELRERGYEAPTTTCIASRRTGVTNGRASPPTPSCR